MAINPNSLGRGPHNVTFSATAATIVGTPLLQAKDNELGEGIAERNILNVKPYPEEYSSLVEQADIFPGIRVDSKAWISISLDGYYEDDFIKTLIDMSYQKANGKRS